jgi:pyruvate/2-oxoglutarate dehydrogenase complex dihydrolipoamide acyltransferase (E2) component
MPKEIRMPALGQTAAELRIVSWLKAEGDSVRRGEPLLEVETDKATLEVEAFTSGTLLKIVRGADEVVEAGSLLAYIGAPGEALSATGRWSDGETGREGKTGLTTGFAGGAPPSPRPPVAPSQSGATRVLATPVARQLARERGVDINQVRGSGPGGRIEKEDVLAFGRREEP